MNVRTRFLLSLASLIPGPLAFAGATLISGPIAIGVNDAGNLIYDDGTVESVNSSEDGMVGLAIQNPDTGKYYDALSPGVLAEGWGVSAGEVSGWVSHTQYLGSRNISVDAAFGDADGFTSLTSIRSGASLSISQEFSAAPASPSYFFQDLITLTNTGADVLEGVQYVRVFDWDVAPTEYEEILTVVGTELVPYLVRSHNNGFSEPDPLVTRPPLDVDTLNTDYTDLGPSDGGAYFRFNFGDLEPGESITFTLYFGATYSEAEALQGILDIGAPLYALAQSSKTSNSPIDGTPYTYIFAYKDGGSEMGTAIIAVPEPAMLVFLLGIVTAAFLPRRRR